MKVLLDECVDPACRSFFSDRHEVRHIKDLGWIGLKNGELVQRASEGFDVLFTIDSNMQHQTSLKGLSLSVAVATGHFRKVGDYEPHVKRFEAVASTLAKGCFTVL